MPKSESVGTNGQDAVDVVETVRLEISWKTFAMVLCRKLCKAFVH